MGQARQTARRLTVITEDSRIQIGDLIVDFTTSFDWTWNDSGSGAHDDASTWRPKPMAGQDGFFPVGDVMLPNYDNPNGSHVAILVKDAGSADRPALMPPTGFAYVWSSQVWMALAPAGYVALGGVARSDIPPATDLYRCVRSDLLAPALVGAQIYNDHGSGRRDDLGCWAIQAATAPAGLADFSPGTFMPVGNYQTPSPVGFWAFEMTMPETPPPSSPSPPLLTSKDPPPSTGDAVRYLVKLPWFAVSDPGMTDPDRIVNSPFYTVIRSDQYVLAQFKNNNTSTPQTQSFSWTEGISSDTVTSFAHTVGIELGMEWSIVKDIFSVSAKLSYSFTYTTSHSQGMQSSTSLTDELTVPAYTAAAAYYIQSSYEIYREDGTRIQTVSPVFGVPSSTYDTQYPQNDAVQRRHPLTVQEA
jgi:hypothetical protein